MTLRSTSLDDASDGVSLSEMAIQLPQVEVASSIDLAQSTATVEQSWDREQLAGETPVVASLSTVGFSLRTFGRLLPEGQSRLAGDRSSNRSPDESKVRRTRTRRERSPRKRYTRIRPPSDVVKLEDRLQYLLQPPLEALLEAKSLRFPFHPFPYQLDGIAFLYPRRHAVLADEMGLGKTMQAISAIRLLAHSGQTRRALLVCPKPLVTNWQRELATWAPELSVVVVEGSQTQRQFVWRQSTAVVTIANYESVVRDQSIIAGDSLPEDAGPLAFDLVVLDESQRIKNSRGATSHAVRSIERDRSWALTGTPIENSVDDLAGIFDFVSPGVVRPGMKPRLMGQAVRDSVLRRTKDRVLTDLPPKIVRDEQIDLSPKQWETYQRAEQEGVIELGGMGSQVTIQHVFELVLRLKQICNFDPVAGDSSKAERLEAELEECVASGRKAIVFSQWVESIQQLTKRLQRFGPLEYHGRVPHRQRDGVIEQFRSDPNSHVILMSYGAGSVGLNLQFAGYVFLFDRWWNPAVEDQAINRAHRIGAAGPVTVTRMIAAGTIEQRIDDVLAQKRELFASVFDDDSRAPTSYGLTRGELLSLFDLQSPEGPVRDAA
ncbi:MAG: DEAD/DEAH box helicase [Planctomycetota bacterium]